MKKYKIDNEHDSGIYYIGAADEIKSLYRSIQRAAYKTNDLKNPEYKTDLFPRFSGYPKFKPYKMYGLKIDADNYFTIVNSDVMLAILVENRVVEEKTKSNLDIDISDLDVKTDNSSVDISDL